MREFPECPEQHKFKFEHVVESISNIIIVMFDISNAFDNIQAVTEAFVTLYMSKFKSLYVVPGTFKLLQFSVSKLLSKANAISMD